MCSQQRALEVLHTWKSNLYSNAKTNTNMAGPHGLRDTPAARRPGVTRAQLSLGVEGKAKEGLDGMLISND